MDSGIKADLIIAESYTGNLSLTLHTSRKADTVGRPKADARPETALNHKRGIKTIFNHFRNTHARFTKSAVKTTGGTQTDAALVLYAC